MQEIHIGYVDSEKRFKVVSDPDCLPDDMTNHWISRTTANLEIARDASERFWHFYQMLRWLENLGFTICIDFGKYFYETGMQGPEIK